MSLVPLANARPMGLSSCGALRCSVVGPGLEHETKMTVNTATAVPMRTAFARAPAVDVTDDRRFNFPMVRVFESFIDDWFS